MFVVHAGRTGKRSSVLSRHPARRGTVSLGQRDHLGGNGQRHRPAQRRQLVLEVGVQLHGIVGVVVAGRSVGSGGDVAVRDVVQKELRHGRRLGVALGLEEGDAGEEVRVQDGVSINEEVHHVVLASFHQKTVGCGPDADQEANWSLRDGELKVIPVHPVHNLVEGIAVDVVQGHMFFSSFLEACQGCEVGRFSLEDGFVGRECLRLSCISDGDLQYLAQEVPTLRSKNMQV